MKRASRPKGTVSRGLKLFLTGLAFAGLSLSPAAQAQTGPQNITGVFTDANSAPDWTIAPAPQVTSAMDGSGWLRLMSPADRGTVGKLQAKARLGSASPIRVEFDVVTWGGHRWMVEGLSINFFDPKAPSAGEGGKWGSGLGYCAMKGAYLGVGIDDYGRFAQSRCGHAEPYLPVAGLPYSNLPGGLYSNVVSVRGPHTSSPATSNPLVTHVFLKDLVAPVCYSCTTRDEAISKAMRHVVLDMVPRTAPDAGFVLNMTINGKDVLKNLIYPYPAPPELTMGIVASTGSASAIMEVRNVNVTMAPPVCFDGVGPDGRCLRAKNALGQFNVFAAVPGFGSGINAPPELVDGDLAQKGWNGNAPWTATVPQIPGYIDVGPQIKAPWLSEADGGPVTANQIVIVSRQDDWANAVDPTESMTFTKHGVVDMVVRYTPLGGVSTIVPGGTVTGNNKVLRVFDLPTTGKVQSVSVVITKTADGNSSPLTEILLRLKQ